MAPETLAVRSECAEAATELILVGSRTRPKSPLHRTRNVMLQRTRACLIRNSVLTTLQKDTCNRQRRVAFTTGNSLSVNKSWPLINRLSRHSPGCDESHRQKVVPQQKPTEIGLIPTGGSVILRRRCPAASRVGTRSVWDKPFIRRRRPTCLGILAHDLCRTSQAVLPVRATRAKCKLLFLLVALRGTRLEHLP
jgi:hypothetical protein